MKQSELCLKNICFVRTGAPGDAGAFERSLHLSERTQAALSITSVVDDHPAGILRLLASRGAPTESITGEGEAATEGERLAGIARRQGVDAASEVLRGSKFVQIVDKVQRDGCDLIVKAAQPSGAIQRVLSGHLDRQLVRKCPCPVWIDKPLVGKVPGRILAAVDPAPFHDEVDVDTTREELNSSILEFAVLLAQTEGAELNVVHVWPFYLEMPLQSRAGFAQEVVAEIGDEIRQTHERALAELLGPYVRQIARVHLLKGEAADELPRLAASELIDVIVMGTICRTGIPGIVIGNTAETVLDQADCSIVALKPSGFVSMS